MREMLNAVEANTEREINKSAELGQANSLMRSAEKEIERVGINIKPNEMQKSGNKLRESMLEASREMVSALQALYVACKLNSLTAKPEVHKPKNDLTLE